MSALYCSADLCPPSSFPTAPPYYPQCSTSHQSVTDSYRRQAAPAPWISFAAFLTDVWSFDYESCCRYCSLLRSGLAQDYGPHCHYDAAIRLLGYHEVSAEEVDDNGKRVVRVLKERAVEWGTAKDFYERVVRREEGARKEKKREVWERKWCERRGKQLPAFRSLERAETAIRQQ